MDHFSAVIEIIGINPYVRVPEEILQRLFEAHGKDKGPIPVKGTLNDKPYTQNLMKFKGVWRLYINTTMLKNSPKRIGETISLTIAYDPEDRSILMHPKLEAALNNTPTAKMKFERLTPSVQKEIIRYISHLKTEESVNRNVERAINFLLGKERFAGREPLQ